MSGRRLTGARVARALAKRGSSFLHRFGPAFRRDLEDPLVPLSFDMESRSRTLLIAFGGMHGGLGMPPFEFFKATGEFAIKRLFVRDLRQAWYHLGIPDFGATITEMGESFTALLAEHDVDRLVVTGTSAGGYGAVVFGALLGAHTVIAFAPQTVLDLKVLAEIKDHRWDDQVRRLEGLGGVDPRWADLRRSLPEADRGNTRYELHYDTENPRDTAHCERLADLAGVHLVPRAGGGHNIAKDMRDSGDLEPLLRAALGEPDGSPSALQRSDS